MTAAQSGVFNLQQFGDIGGPLVAGRLYTYISGTTTHKTAYTDAGGTIPHTYTSDGAGGLYIGLNSRGELPAPMYLSSGLYDIALKRADGSTVWTRSADGTASLGNMSASSGSSLIGFINAAAGAVARTAQDELRDTVKVTQWGAVGDGRISDGPKVASALFGSLTKKLHFPAGTYDLSGMSTPTFMANLHITGDGVGKTIIKGISGKNFIQLQGGSSIRATGITFDTWSAPVKLLSNSGGTPFGRLIAEDCEFNNIEISSISDRTTPANGGIFEVRFCKNVCTNIGQINSINSAALRLDSDSIYSAFVNDNEIRTVGGSSYSGQKDGISLGAVSLSSLSSLVVSNNRIYDVKNSTKDHISGITVFGRSTRVVDNSINIVQSATSSNVDQYGVYTKSSYSNITGNNLVDAGGNAACIMTKGYPNDANGRPLNADDNDNIIADNTILITSRWSGIGQIVAISDYNSGMNIHDNTAEGMNIGIVQIPPVYAENSRISIHHNKIRKLRGIAGQSVIGIQLQNPSDISVEDNEIYDVGSGVELVAQGIYMYNYGASSCANITICGNNIKQLFSSVAYQTRGINLVFDATGSVTDMLVSDNYIASSERGIQASYSGTISGLDYVDNRVRGCATSTYDFSGTAPTTGVISGQTIDGLSYTELSTNVNSSTPSVGGVNQIRTANTLATTITNFLRGFGNQVLVVEINDANTTIQHNASIKLAGAVNFAPGANGGILTVKRMAGVWKELSRCTY